MFTENSRGKFILILSIGCAFLYVVFLQFVSPAFYDPDSYYHIAISNFIKHYGLRYPFDWVQFSVFKNSFSDKDIFFHILNLPFLFFTDNLVLAGKCAFVFNAGLFLLAYAVILRKYLPYGLAAVFLLLPFTSSSFIVYFLQLRSFTLANIFTIVGIYFLIKKRLFGIFIVSLLYTWTHISFFTIVFLALICEVLRSRFDQEFFLKNIYAATAGVVVGFLLHPNFPNNFLSFYLNGIMVPWYSLSGTNVDFGSELLAFGTNVTLVANGALFALSYWSDVPYFLCLNPKDKYINILDPIYMLWPFPREHALLEELSLGKVDKPEVAINKIFKADYGYLHKSEPLYRQLRNSAQYFKIIYEDIEGVVFELVKG
ncbi:MAG: hypothetical protein NTY14_04710 [Candidatus Omnitrophica bacterium]|nr:hypothetical protein [Candidatus Omnitrophota bacterium]